MAVQKNPLFTAVMFALLSVQQLSAVEQQQQYGKGLIRPTKEELEHHRKHFRKADKVRPNKLAVARIKMHLEKTNSNKEAPEAHPWGEELTSDEAFTPISHVLPSYVDNSTLPSFPLIGNQEMLSSCVAWGTTYYQTTHEIGLANGNNNKINDTCVLSPKWTYNLCNGGQDMGLQFSDAYTLLAASGAMTLANLPYDTNYLSWDTNAQDWFSALSYRVKPCTLVEGINQTPQDLTAIKTLLANGHILTVGTFIESWQTTTISANPSTKNRWVGQMATAWQNGEMGGHCMTVVGYDDDVWIDVNGNGQVDPGEMGAFLIANSWSSEWGNNGFVWVAYDAFLSTSAVAGMPGPDEGRTPLSMMPYLMSTTARAPHYSPLLVAEFQLAQAERDQVSIAIGSSLGSGNNIAVALPTIFHSTGGHFEFDGKAPIPSHPESGSFALDLTDLVIKNPTYDRFYLKISEMASGVLHSFSLIDPVNQKTIPYNGKLPLTIAPHAVSTPSILYMVPSNTKTPERPKPLESHISSPQNQEKVRGAMHVTVYAPPPATRVDILVDGNLVSTDREAPFHQLLNTARWKNGSHQIQAVVYDDAERSVSHRVEVFFDN